VDEVERVLIEEIVESVAKRHEGTTPVGKFGAELAWLKKFHSSLRRVVAKYEKRLIVIPRPTVAVRPKQDSVSGPDPRPVSSRSPAAGRRETADAPPQHQSADRRKQKQ